MEINYIIFYTLCMLYLFYIYICVNCINGYNICNNKKKCDNNYQIV